MSMYIVLEGPACAGKGTQIELLKEWFEELGCSVAMTREPGGPGVAEKVRKEIFRLKGEEVLSKEDEMWMFYVAREYNMEWVEQQFREGVDVVLKDRDYMSTMFFQAESGNSEEMLSKYHRELYEDQGFREPDLRVVLMPSEKELRSRLMVRGAEGDVFDRVMDYVLAVRKRYELNCEGDFSNTVMIDGDGSVDEVFGRITEVVVDELWGFRKEREIRGKERL